MKVQFCADCPHTLKDHTRYIKLAGKFKGTAPSRCRRCKCAGFVEKNSEK